MTHAQRIEAVCEQFEPPPHVAQLRRARQEVRELRDQLADAYALIDDLQTQLCEAHLERVARMNLER